MIRLLFRSRFYRGSSRPSTTLLQSSRTLKEAVSRKKAMLFQDWQSIVDLSVVEDKWSKKDIMEMLWKLKDLGSGPSGNIEATHHAIDLEEKTFFIRQQSSLQTMISRRAFWVRRQAAGGKCSRGSSIREGYSHLTGANNGWKPFILCTLPAPQRRHDTSILPAAMYGSFYW